MKIRKEDCTGLIIDFQERLVPTIAGNRVIIRNTNKLVRGLKVFKVPVYFTQQNTRALGSTVNDLRNTMENFSAVEKMCFSCFNEPQLEQILKNDNKKYIIIAGVETHICVLQTVLDLLNNNYIPVVVEDCTGSSREREKEVAMWRMRKEGAMLTTSESILYELCNKAGNDDFRELLKLVKETNNA